MVVSSSEYKNNYLMQQPSSDGNWGLLSKANFLLLGPCLTTSQAFISIHCYFMSTGNAADNKKSPANANENVRLKTQ